MKTLNLLEGDELDTQEMALLEMFSRIMEDPSMTPLFCARQGLMVPILDDEESERSWSKLLRNLH